MIEGNLCLRKVTRFRDVLDHRVGQSKVIAAQRLAAFIEGFDEERAVGRLPNKSV